MSECKARKTARLGRVTLGEGMPAICVPVMGRTIPEIAQAAARAKAAQADVIELRIDSLTDMPLRQQAVDACRAVRENAGEIPLLFTMRTRRDGGAGSADAEAYETLLCAVIESRACDAVDCELSVGEEAFARIAEKARKAGVLLVGSSHEFGEIGDMRRAAQWLRRQEALGADVCKAAVMTRTNAEAFALAQVYASVCEELTIPMIAIAMGPAGVITRIGGACLGSCLTFGTAGEASAPGQIDARRLRTALEIVQDAIG
ncbi:MAG: type I 3-dehydroquinate dehydratase [Candidatus Ventricola sp.]